MTAIAPQGALQRPSRRQALKIIGAAAGVPLVIGAGARLAPQPQFHSWSGTTMGAEASLSLWHGNRGFAQRTIARMLSEVARLENVFSLFRPESELSRLNRDGVLATVSRDLVVALDAAAGASVASAGAFDVTVQALWQVYERHFARPGADPAGPPGTEIAAALRLVDYTSVDIGPTGVRLGRAGSAVTLNGIAQGYITDRIADLLRNEGFDHVLVELGETRVLGNLPDGQPWIAGIRDRFGGVANTLPLSNQALSVSGGYATTFEPTGRNHHIFDPDTGRSADGLITVAVRAPRAMTADALSTAILVSGEANARGLLEAYPGASATIFRSDGSLWTSQPTPA